MNRLIAILVLISDVSRRIFWPEPELDVAQRRGEYPFFCKRNCGDWIVVEFVRHERDYSWDFISVRSLADHGVRTRKARLGRRRRRLTRRRFGGRREIVRQVVVFRVCDVVIAWNDDIP